MFATTEKKNNAPNQILFKIVYIYIINIPEIF